MERPGKKEKESSTFDKEGSKVVKETRKSLLAERAQKMGRGGVQVGVLAVREPHGPYTIKSETLH